jgi:hypothetical protein
VTLHKVAWEAKPRTTFADDKWEPYNTAEDFSCSNDLSANEPAKLKEMQGLFMAEATKHNVLPLDDRVMMRFNATLAGRPDYMEGRTSLTLYPGMVGMKENACIDVKNRSSSITAELELPPGNASGVILSQGGAHSGWSLYVKSGRPVFAYNLFGKVTTIASSERLPEGKITVTYDFAYDGGKPGAGGTGALSLRGLRVATVFSERYGHAGGQRTGPGSCDPPQFARHHFVNSRHKASRSAALTSDTAIDSMPSFRHSTQL